MPLTGITPGTMQFRLRVTGENRTDGKRQWEKNPIKPTLCQNAMAREASGE